MSENQFPSEWQITSLEGVGTVVTGKTPSKKDPRYFGGSIPFIKPGDVNDQGVITQTDEYITDIGAETVPEIPSGSIVVTCIGNLGRCAITSERSATNQQINSVIPSNNVDVSFIYYQLRTLKEWMLSESSATTVTIINKSKFSKAPIVIPPLAEQKVIAEKLDTLLAQVETTKARLESTLETLKQFRQSVLAAAVSGKLTEDWRNFQEENRQFNKLGNVGIDVKTGPFGSALHKSDYLVGGIPVINPMHISGGCIYPSDNMSISDIKFDELSAWHLREGDVIVGRRGEMGRAAVVNTSEKQLCGTGSMILRANENVVPKYLELILRSPIAVDYFNRASVGSTMVNLNQKVIKSLEVYFPTFEEQVEIVNRVEKLYLGADATEQQVSQALKRVNNLTQSILAKAFRGELTEQWRKDNPDLISGDNSAEALLKKIKAEREAAKPKRKTTK